MADFVALLEITAGALGLAVVVLLVLWIRKFPYSYTKDDVEGIVDQRLKQQLYVVKGAVGEQLAPHMKEFLAKYEPADARFLGGKPVDYIVYRGYSRVYNTDDPLDEIVFLEVKTSKNVDRKPDKNEAKIRDAIAQGRVKYDVLTVHLEQDNPASP